MLRSKLSVFDFGKRKVPVLPVSLNTLSNQRAASGSKSTGIAGLPKPQEFESLLTEFYKLNYILCLTPYYPCVTTIESGQSRVNSLACIIHTMLVVLVHLCTITRLIMRISILPWDMSNPINYFKIATALLSAFSCLFFMWNSWRRHTQLTNLIHRLANFTYFPNVTYLRKKWVQSCILFLFIGVLCVTSIYRTLDEGEKPKKIICENGYFSSPRILCAKITPYLDSFFEIVLGIANTFARATRRLPRINLLIFGLTLWQMTKSYARILQQQWDKRIPDIPVVLAAYEELKKICDEIRNLVAEILILEIMKDIAYFSLEVQLTIRDTGWFSIFVIVETWLVGFLAYFIAAIAAEHIQALNNWMASDEVIGELSPGKITILSMQLSTNPIALKGGNLFTVTKSFLANVVAVWLTYFVILLQFQASVQ